MSLLHQHDTNATAPITSMTAFHHAPDLSTLLTIIFGVLGTVCAIIGIIIAELQLRKTQARKDRDGLAENEEEGVELERQ